MQIGIKCEIHKCTIAFAKKFLNFTNEEYNLIEIAFNARQDAQYYVDREVSGEDFYLIINNAKEFLIKCKNINLSEKEINYIRNAVMDMR